MALRNENHPAAEIPDTTWEIGAEFARRDAARAFAELDFDSLLREEVAERIARLGILAAGNFIITPARQNAFEPRLLSVPFIGSGLNGYHAHRRVTISRQNKKTNTVFTNDWLIDMQTGHSLKIPSKVDFEDVGKSAIHGPVVAVRHQPFPKAGLAEGATYMGMLHTLTDNDLIERSDPSGFMRDTQSFVGGTLSMLDMHDPDAYKHNAPAA